MSSASPFTLVRLAPLCLGLIVLSLDFVSKLWVNQFIPVMKNAFAWYPYGGIGVFKNFMGIEFSIVYHTNKGAAWGFFADYQEQLLWLRIGLIAALCIYLFLLNHHKQWEIPLILVLAGATGNVIDFFLYGHVVDMFHFVFWGYDYPVFNVADASICMGIAWLFISTSFASTASHPKKKKA